MTDQFIHNKVSEENNYFREVLIMTTKQNQVENLVFRAFGQMGDDLGDLLYDEEAIN